MNMFKTLDSIFPTGSARTFGEVVGVTIEVRVDGVLLTRLYEKRKAWYVNASVNAFHMHRSLVREFTEQVRDLSLTTETIRRAKRLIAIGVMCSYIRNYESDEQYFQYHLGIWAYEALPTTEMWWDAKCDGQDLREVVDNGFGLAAICTMSVIQAKDRVQKAQLAVRNL